MKLFFHDTETTGFPKTDGAFCEGQAVVVQHAFKVVDSETRRVLAQAEYILDTGVYINSHVEAIHGVSNGLAADVGLTPDLGYKFLHENFLKSDRVVVAHNAKFDKEMTQIMLDRTLGEGNHEWPSAEHRCTMALFADWCKMPPSAAQLKKGMTAYKQPKLEEASWAILGKPHVGAHNAMNDVNCMIEIFFKVLDLMEEGMTPEEFEPFGIPAKTAE